MEIETEMEVEINYPDVRRQVSHVAQKILTNLF